MEDSSLSETSAFSSAAMNEDSVQEWLLVYLANQIKIDKQDIDITQSIASFGLDSVEVANLSADMIDWLGRDLPATLVWDYPTIELLARHINSM